MYKKYQNRGESSIRDRPAELGIGRLMGTTPNENRLKVNIRKQGGDEFLRSPDQVQSQGI